MVIIDRIVKLPASPAQPSAEREVSPKDEKPAEQEQKSKKKKNE